MTLSDFSPFSSSSSSSRGICIRVVCFTIVWVYNLDPQYNFQELEWVSISLKSGGELNKFMRVELGIQDLKDWLKRLTSFELGLLDLFSFHLYIFYEMVDLLSSFLRKLKPTSLSCYRANHIYSRLHRQILCRQSVTGGCINNIK